LSPALADKPKMPKMMAAVHPSNPNCPTSTGSSHWHSAIFALVTSPHRRLRASGKLTSEHTSVRSGWNCLKSGARRHVDQVVARGVAQNERVEDRADHERRRVLALACNVTNWRGRSSADRVSLPKMVTVMGTQLTTGIILTVVAIECDGSLTDEDQNHRKGH
jgi:hypothetical protein